MTDDIANYRNDPHYTEIKSTHELIEEINKYLHYVEGITNDSLSELKTIAHYTEENFGHLNRLDSRLYEIERDVRFLANRGNAHPGIFLVLLAILIVLCDVHYGLFDYLKAVTDSFFE